LWQGSDIAQFPSQAEASAGARLRADADAVARAARLARGFAAQTGLDPAAASRLTVVVEEWVTNVVTHGGPQAGARIVLRLSLSEEVVRLWISDGGRPFDPRAAVFEGPDLEHGGGSGLALIAGFCRITGYARLGGRNRLVLEMPLE